MPYHGNRSVDQFLTEREAAARLALAPGTLRNWRHQGEGPPWVRIGTRSVRYSATELADFVKAAAA